MCNRLLILTKLQTIQECIISIFSLQHSNTGPVVKAILVRFALHQTASKSQLAAGCNHKVGVVRLIHLLYVCVLLNITLKCPGNG